MSDASPRVGGSVGNATVANLGLGGGSRLGSAVAHVRGSDRACEAVLRVAGARATLACAALVVGVGASAEVDERGAFEITRSATVDHPLLVLPRLSVAGVASVDGWRLSATDEDGFRVYRATRGDRVRTVRVAVSAPSHVAFNPATSRFERLGQNVRVELRDPGALDRVVEAAGGTGGKAYPLLGFALVHLPAGADPVGAARSIREMPVVVSARLTVRGPRRKPR